MLRTGTIIFHIINYLILFYSSEKIKQKTSVKETLVSYSYTHNIMLYNTIMPKMINFL